MIGTLRKEGNIIGHSCDRKRRESEGIFEQPVYSLYPSGYYVALLTYLCSYKVSSA